MHLRLEVLHGLPWALAQILFCDFGSRESVLASLGFDGSVDMLCCRVCVCVRTSVGYGRFGEQDDDILLKRPTIRLICRYSRPEYIKSVCSITIYE